VNVWLIEATLIVNIPPGLHRKSEFGRHTHFPQSPRKNSLAPVSQRMKCRVIE
jgi:hypothetical protein